MGREKTKDLLLDVGMKTFLERGYANSGIETILQAAKVPKGSFYYYFESKEDFGLKVLDRFAECYDEAMNRSFGDESLPPVDRFRRYFEEVVDRFDSGQCRKGCLIGRLSQELADHSEAFRVKLEEILRRWVDRYTECLRLAEDSGEVDPILPVRDVADLWLSGWQGAMLRAKTARDSAPLRTFLDVMFRHVLRVPPSRSVAEHSPTDSGPLVVGSSRSTG